MTSLTPPRPPVVAAALDLARSWCAGHIIDGAPALAHAAAVAVTLGTYAAAEATPEAVAAALLHDAPEYAPCLLDATITERLGSHVLRLVRAVEQAHHGMAAWTTDPGASRTALRGLLGDRPAVLVSAADKLVSLRSILRRAGRTAHPDAYWTTRSAFLGHAGYFRVFADHAAPALPPLMHQHLDRLTTTVEDIAQYTRPGTTRQVTGTPGGVTGGAMASSPVTDQTPGGAVWAWPPGA